MLMLDILTKTIQLEKGFAFYLVQLQIILQILRLDFVFKLAQLITTDKILKSVLLNVQVLDGDF